MTIAEGYRHTGIVDGGRAVGERVNHEPSPRPPPDIGKGKQVENYSIMVRNGSLQPFNKRSSREAW